MKILALKITVIVLTIFIGSIQAQETSKNPLQLTAKSINNGKNIFKKSCTSCHGLPTEGKTLTPDIPDVGASESISKADGDLFKTLSNGVAAMPGFKNQLSEEECWSLINYIRSFDPKMKGKIIGTLVFPKLSFKANADEHLKTINIAVAEMKGVKNIPLSQLDVNFFAQRSFGRIALFDEPRKTNEHGMLTVAVPEDIHGDEEGNIEIIAQVADVDNYGEVTTSVEGKLAKAAQHENILKKRCLWGINSKIPIWLLFSYIGVMILIWGGVIFTVIKLIGLRKMN